MHTIVEGHTTLQTTVSHFIATQSEIQIRNELRHAEKHKPKDKIRVRNPRTFNGKYDEVEPFLNELEDILFFNDVDRQLSDKERAIYLGLYLDKGIPTDWYARIKKDQPALLETWDEFVESFRKKFADPNIESTNQRKLDKLKQTGTVHAYIAQFHELARHLDLTEQSKCNQFLRGLSKPIKDALVPIVKRPDTVDGWETIVITIYNNIHQYDQDAREERMGRSQSSSHHNHRANYPSTSSNSDVVPMDVDAIRATRVGRGRLTAEERDYRFKNKLCLYCGKAGHVVDACLSRKAKHDKQAQGKALPRSN